MNSIICYKCKAGNCKSWQGLKEGGEGCESASYQRIESTSAFLIDDIIMQPQTQSTEAGMSYEQCKCQYKA